MLQRTRPARLPNFDGVTHSNAQRAVTRGGFTAGKRRGQRPENRPLVRRFTQRNSLQFAACKVAHKDVQWPALPTRGRAFVSIRQVDRQHVADRNRHREDGIFRLQRPDSFWHIAAANGIAVLA